MTNHNTYRDTLTLSDPNLAPLLFGINDDYLKLLERFFSVQASAFSDHILIEAEDSQQVALARDTLSTLVSLLEHQVVLSQSDVLAVAKMAKRHQLSHVLNLYTSILARDIKGRPIRPKTMGQKQYVASILNSDVTFGIGPAGTGKTFLAVMLAINALKQNEVERIIITRPAVEAGESLGFLPGDLKEKVDPYLRPIYDAFYQLLGMDQTNRLMERGTVEVAPLAYMRGRTLENAFVILDEAQNTTPAQMKMFLTRLGVNSKMIVNGDVSQIDLPTHQKSGLVEAQTILKDVASINFVEFSAEDVVRHPVVAAIIEAYEKFKARS